MPVLAVAWPLVALSWSFVMGSAARIIAKPGPPSAGDWPDRAMPVVALHFSMACAREIEIEIEIERASPEAPRIAVDGPHAPR
jgi:hypothetical protein